MQLRVSIPGTRRALLHDMEPGRSLPKHLYLRGSKLWARVKIHGAWKSLATGCTVDQVAEAQAFVARAIAEANAPAPLTVQSYAERWLQDREARGVAAVVDDRARFERHIAPFIGAVHLTALRPLHARDLVRTLRSAPPEERLAPRTIGHVFALLRNMLGSAVIEELVPANPIKVELGVLPRMVDGDREWRAQATFEMREVELLVSDPRVPIERRVLHALKALAGLRHGEAAALAWRHIDRTAQPLARLNVVRSWCSRSGAFKRTKSEESRAVPLHPALDRILTAWRAQWSSVYGREPGPDDLVVPARTGAPIDVKDAVAAFKRDLHALGLRVEAGELRDRGGHDLRSWFKTAAIECGANALIVRRTTHSAPRDVNGGYERFSWAATCAEIAKLRIEVTVPAELPPRNQQRAAALARWTSERKHEEMV